MQDTKRHYMTSKDIIGSFKGFSSHLKSLCTTLGPPREGLGAWTCPDPAQSIDRAVRDISGRFPCAEPLPHFSRLR